MTSDRVDGLRAIRKADEGIRRRVRTVLYGNVVSYDPGQRKARVQPARLARDKAGVPFPLPQLPACPVLWPMFSSVILEGRLDPGDPVLILVSDREADGFMAAGAAPVPPRSTRLHSMADAFVMPTLIPSSRLARAGAANVAEAWLGQGSRTAGLAIGHDLPVVTLEGQPAAGILLGRGASQPAVWGTALVTALNTYAGAITAAFNTWGATVPATPATNATLNTAIAAAQTALATALGLALSAKVMVG